MLNYIYYLCGYNKDNLLTFKYDSYETSYFISFSSYVSRFGNQ